MIPTPSRRKKLASEPDFERPPLWIHEVVAGILAPGAAERKYVPSKREAKRRELLEMLDRIPVQATDRKPVRQPRKPAAPAAAADPAAAKPPSGPSAPARR